MSRDKNLIKPSPTDVRGAQPCDSGRVFRPYVDILEGREGVTLIADMPGVTQEDLDIQVSEGTLTLHGKVAPRQVEGTRFLAREYELGDFKCAFSLADSTDINGINAELMNGVLTLNLPKSKAALPRKIEVTSPETS